MERENRTVNTLGSHHDFSEQEGHKTATLMPPKFGLTAGAAARDGGAKGREVVPFGGFGGDLEFDAECTTTVLGRAVEGASTEEQTLNLNCPTGTNYFRYQPEFMVGNNKGGGNVLDVPDKAWSWPLNNAWLQASLDRGDRIRFISDPADPSTLYKKGGSIKDKLTVTGKELGVLLNRGHAPDEHSGLVKKGYQPKNDQLWREWKDIRKEVAKDDLKAIDADAYTHFLHAAQTPARAAKTLKAPSGDIVAVQTNFFGGRASDMVAG